MKAAGLFVECLENEGVPFIFGLPGEENLDVMDALVDSPLSFIRTRHEQGTTFMCDVQGGLTGKHRSHRPLGAALQFLNGLLILPPRRRPPISHCRRNKRQQLLRSDDLPASRSRTDTDLPHLTCPTRPAAGPMVNLDKHREQACPTEVLSGGLGNLADAYACTLE